MLSRKAYAAAAKSTGHIRNAKIGEENYRELVENFAKANKFICRADVVRRLHVDETKAYRLLKALATE